MVSLMIERASFSALYRHAADCRGRNRFGVVDQNQRQGIGAALIRHLVSALHHIVQLIVRELGIAFFYCKDRITLCSIVKVAAAFAQAFSLIRQQSPEILDRFGPQSCEWTIYQATLSIAEPTPPDTEKYLQTVVVRRFVRDEGVGEVDISGAHAERHRGHGRPINASTKAQGFARFVVVFNADAELDARRFGEIG